MVQCYTCFQIVTYWSRLGYLSVCLCLCVCVCVHGQHSWESDIYYKHNMFKIFHFTRRG